MTSRSCAELLFFRRGNERQWSVVEQGIEFLATEALRIVVAAITKFRRQWTGLLPVLSSPPGMSGLDDVHVFKFQRVPRLILRYKNLVQLFAGANSDGLHLAIGCKRLGHFKQTHAGNLWHENFSTMHLLEAADDESDTSLEGNPEASHAGIGDRDFPVLTLL